MEADEADAAHSREVTVQRPNFCLVVSCNGGDQKVSETETLACRPCNIEPFVDTRPRLLIWKENWKSRQDATETRIVAIRSADQDLDPNRRSKRDIAGVE
ncbi:MAG: hypothetical protein QOE68_2433 [Thermoanaerobaculia bacterium]|nr:hypothetical protein [Thermoanaerobaculia bacterium]